MGMQFYRIKKENKEAARAFLEEHNIRYSFPMLQHDPACIVSFVGPREETLRVWFELRFI